jgi:hypothetical protein
MVRLQLVVRFSTSDGCERVDGLIMNVLSICTLIWTFITHPLVYIHQKTKIAAKIASVNGPLEEKVIKPHILFHYKSE